MVVGGSFSVELVDAETKVPFKEHQQDGETYVEVEPGAEYLIKIKSQYSRAVKCGFDVDGKNLGYGEFLGFGEHKHCGITAPGMTSSRAIKLKEISHHFSPDSPDDWWVGSVVVGFYDFELLGWEKNDDTNNSKNNNKNNNESEETGNASLPVEGDALGTACPSSLGSGKGVKSTAGRTVIEHDGQPDLSHRPVHRYTLLESITLRYCTAVGLIQVGILPKPPIWDFHRMRHARVGSAEQDKNVVHVEPKTISIHGNPELGTSDKEVLLYDFTDVE